jgi:hypothetical protein
MGAAMEKGALSTRTHSRRELAPARPPVLLGLLVAGSAVMLFALLTQLLR